MQIEGFCIPFFHSLSSGIGGLFGCQLRIRQSIELLEAVESGQKIQ